MAVVAARAPELGALCDDLGIKRYEHYGTESTAIPMETMQEIMHLFDQANVYKEHPEMFCFRGTELDTESSVPTFNFTLTSTQVNRDGSESILCKYAVGDRFGSSAAAPEEELDAIRKAHLAPTEGLVELGITVTTDVHAKRYVGLSSETLTQMKKATDIAFASINTGSGGMMHKAKRAEIFSARIPENRYAITNSSGAIVLTYTPELGIKAHDDPVWMKAGAIRDRQRSKKGFLGKLCC
jgi:hypothetical protein